MWWKEFDDTYQDEMMKMKKSTCENNNNLLKILRSLKSVDKKSLERLTSINRNVTGLVGLFGTVGFTVLGLSMMALPFKMVENFFTHLFK